MDIFKVVPIADITVYQNFEVKRGSRSLTIDSGTPYLQTICLKNDLATATVLVSDSAMKCAMRLNLSQTVITMVQ